MDKARILVPTGIGDIYWVMVKLRAFCRRQGITGKPAVSIMASHDDVGHLRSLPFLEMVPFVDVGDPVVFPIDPVLPRPDHIQQIYQESFNECGRTAYPGFHGYDYFLNYNGIINSGHWLDGCDDLDCEWDLELSISGEQKRFRQDCLDRYGPYMALYWTFNGNYVDYQLAQFPLDKLAESIRRISIDLGLRPVFLGSWWDLQYNDLLSTLISMVPKSVDLVGSTSLGEAFGVLRGSELVLSYHSGLTNMAAAFGKKTVLLWPSSLPFKHWWPASIPLAVVPPKVRNTTYRPVFTGGLTVDGLMNVVKDLLQ